MVLCEALPGDCRSKTLRRERYWRFPVGVLVHRASDPSQRFDYIAQGALMTDAREVVAGSRICSFIALGILPSTLNTP